MSITEEFEAAKRMVFRASYRPVSRTVAVPHSVWSARFELPAEFWRYLGVDPADLPPVAPPVAPDRPESA